MTRGRSGHREGMILLAFLCIGTVFGSVAAKTYAQGACTDDDAVIRMNYSLYLEDYRNKSFEVALPYLRWILKCTPTFPGGDRNFRRAVETYEGIGLNSEDSGIRRVYLDSALYILDTAVTSLQDAGFDEVDEFRWIMDKSRFIQKYPDELEDLQTTIGDIYRRLYDLDPTKLQWYYLNYIITDFVRNDRKSDAIDFMDDVEMRFSGNEEILNGLDQWRGSLFTSPEERMGFLEGRLEKTPDDLELITELFELYLSEGLRDRVYDLAPRLLELDPSARALRLIGKMRLDDGDTDEAISLYRQSLEMEGGPEAAKEVYFNIGIAHQQEGRLSRARTSFRRALREDPSFGDALIAIGNLYVTAVASCGSFEREDKAVYWLAADYFDRAAARNQSAAATARQRISSIRSSFPTAEEKFFKNWSTGDSYTIDYGCYTWIGETTRVR